MKTILMTIISIFLIADAKSVFAGAAVQAQKQKAARQQIIAQQQAIQAPPRQIDSVQQPVTPSSFPAKQKKIDRLEATRSKPSGPTSHVEEDDVFDMLDDNSEVWMKIVQANDKLYVVKRYIERYRKNRVYIRYKPQLYVMAIDDLLKRNPQYIQKPFEHVLMIMAVMQYDFDNGEDQD